MTEKLPDTTQSTKGAIGFLSRDIFGMPVIVLIGVIGAVVLGFVVATLGR